MEKPQNVELAGKGGSVWSPPCKDGNRIFFAAMDRLLYCINEEGTVLWTYRTNDRIICPPFACEGQESGLRRFHGWLPLCHHLRRKIALEISPG